MTGLAAEGIVVRVGLYLLVFWPTVGYYVYADATRRDLSVPWLRAVVLGVLGVPGLFVHLATRPSGDR